MCWIWMIKVFSIDSFPILNLYLKLDIFLSMPIFNLSLVSGKWKVRALVNQWNIFFSFLKLIPSDRKPMKNANMYSLFIMTSISCNNSRSYILFSKTWNLSMWCLSITQINKDYKINKLVKFSPYRQKHMITHT